MFHNPCVGALPPYLRSKYKKTPLAQLTVLTGADTGIHSGRGMRDFEKGKFYKKGKKGDFILNLSL